MLLLFLFMTAILVGRRSLVGSKFANSMVLVLCLLPQLSWSKQIVTYAWAASMSNDERGHYPIALLKLALLKSGENFEARPSKISMPQWRTLRQVQMGKELDVVWTMTNPEREEELLPIRIPIDRGLLGWRLLLINANQTQQFANLTAPNELRHLRAGQGHDWPDYPILLANQFKVSPSSSYEGLFEMLKRGRIDYFPRSVMEIDVELQAHSSLDFRVAPNWVLYYPAPLYFFVKKDQIKLAAAIERGLLIAMKDGSMRTLFLKQFGAVIAQADLKNRRILKLDNPYLSSATPLQHRELWFSPALGF
ncbi:hypothetical protein [Undibacterium fentianense]|uniref:Solute-binding protein family 3/N-terminal domain-containing protein n=1 Tax=Undibacterium fentianense TaxID=2828728 RepID=A0A941E6U5_9BURK|nr:hypothetical protein [Undibacterium fentianense]MBR7799793.1 hypothetical protein [Undibacterium fentianense]